MWEEESALLGIRGLSTSSTHLQSQSALLAVEFIILHKLTIVIDTVAASNHSTHKARAQELLQARK